jgi:hypothetical protein
MGFAQVGEAGESRVFRVEPGIYLVRLSGHLTAAISREITALLQADLPSGPRAVLYETTDGFAGYDPDLREIELKNPALAATAHIGIITSSTILRMVTATIALGLRAATGIPMASYGSLESAVDGARWALKKHPVPPMSWSALVDFYSDLTTRYGWKVEPMLRLVEKIAASRYAKGLFGTTSHSALLICRNRETFDRGLDVLRIEWRIDQFRFEYRESDYRPIAWSHSCGADEGFASLEQFLREQKRWLVD